MHSGMKLNNIYGGIQFTPVVRRICKLSLPINAPVGEIALNTTNMGPYSHKIWITGVN